MKASFPSAGCRLCSNCQRQQRAGVGFPWENGYNERFTETLRREILKTEWFTTAKQAQIAINHRLRQYNPVS
jgi:hypothetical protein